MDPFIDPSNDSDGEGAAPAGINSALMSPTLPARPHLGPISPRGDYSAISSLAASPLSMAQSARLQSAPSQLALDRAAEAIASMARSTPDSPIARTTEVPLLQMLSMVGSRFAEAEGEGLMMGQRNDGSDDEAFLGPAMQAVSLMEGDEEGKDSDADDDDDSVIQSMRLPGGLARVMRRQGVLSEMLDDQATPLGGRTPMSGSFAGPSRVRSSARRPLGVQATSSSAGAEAAPAAPAHQASHEPLSDREAEGDVEESSSDADISASIESLPAAAAHGKAREVSHSLASSDSSLSAGSGGMDPSASIHSLSSALLPEGYAKIVSPSTERRDELSTKLQSIFGLDASEAVRCCHPCWLFRSVLLQGYLYLTSGHLLFYAYLPSRGDRVLRAGALRKRTQRTHRFSRHWAVLRGRALSWYDSERDPYFPQDYINLRDVAAVEVDPDVKHNTHFTVKTPYRLFTFATDSVQSRDDWIAVLRKAVFRAQNEGESVRIGIPLETIVDVEANAAKWGGSGGTAAAGGAPPESSHTDMVCVKVVDGAAEDFAIDEYFFLQVADQEAFLATLRSAMADHARDQAYPAVKRNSIRDSLAGLRSSASASSLEDAPKLASPVRTSPASGSIPLPSSLAQGQPQPISIPGSQARQPGSATQTGSAGSGSHFFGLSATPRATTSTLEAQMAPNRSLLDSHTYPPEPSFRVPPTALETRQRGTSERGWAGSVPSWVKEASGRILAATPGAETLAALAARPRRAVRESWSRPPEGELVEGSSTTRVAQRGSSEVSTSGDMDSSGYSVLQAPEDAEEDDRDEEMEKQFRGSFSLPPEEDLLCHLSASLYRVLPVAGRVFVSNNYFCFRSSRLATKTVGRTLMILPMAEIVSAARHKAFRYGQQGLVVMIRGHEELFLEFPSPERRDLCLSLIETQVEVLRGRLARSDAEMLPPSQEHTDALLLTDLGQHLDCKSVAADPDTASAVSSSASHSGAIFQSSTSSTFLDATPKSMHFTFLTIGSRGDVQPFIALARRLKVDGHRVRIATHAEFKPWIEGHGIEFREVGGDPAELMRICVENGTFTVSFLREGVTKFRGWLDDLLESCWHACQGTDVVVESPNAIAGIHVAEALQLPYFRAFTMCWSRTRAYPHAFAVPSSKAGGSYNYMTYVIFDQVFWRASAGQINAWRKKTLGLRSTNLDKLEPHRVPFLYNFSPSLVPKPLDWYDWIHVTGFWFLDNPDNSATKSWEPPRELVAFIERARAAQRKLVYIGWGSIVVQDAEAVTRCVFEAVKRSGVCAILSKGWSDRLSNRTAMSPGAGAPLRSDDIYQVDSVPHDWLFPQLDAACHHGGAGTVGASLRAGIPTIVKPFFGDQFFWGTQVESLGVGSYLRTLTAEALADALVKATQNARQIERARQLGVQLRKEDGVGNAVKCLYRELEYARSLIRRDTRLPTTPAPAAAQPANEMTCSAPAASTTSSAAGAPDLPASLSMQSSSGSAHGGSSSASASDAEWSVVSGSEEDGVLASPLASRNLSAEL